MERGLASFASYFDLKKSGCGGTLRWVCVEERMA
jgi:hypothetical protein